MEIENEGGPLGGELPRAPLALPGAFMSAAAVGHANASAGHSAMAAQAAQGAAGSAGQSAGHSAAAAGQSAAAAAASVHAAHTASAHADQLRAAMEAAEGARRECQAAWVALEEQRKQFTAAMEHMESARPVRHADPANTDLIASVVAAVTAAHRPNDRNAPPPGGRDPWNVACVSEWHPRHFADDKTATRLIEVLERRLVTPYVAQPGGAELRGRMDHLESWVMSAAAFSDSLDVPSMVTNGRQAYGRVKRWSRVVESRFTVSEAELIQAERVEDASLGDIDRAFYRLKAAKEKTRTSANSNNNKKQTKGRSMDAKEKPTKPGVKPWLAKNE